MKRSMLGVAVAVGIAAGAAGAVVRADDSPAPRTAAVAVQATPAGTPVPLGRTKDGRYLPHYQHPRISDVKVVARADDPGGGPPWVLRTLDLERVTVPRPVRSIEGVKGRYPRRCVQLGRMQNGAFGWVYGASWFQPNELEDHTMVCASPKRAAPVAETISALAISADPSQPRITATVIFGYLPGATAASVTGTDGADGPAVGQDGAFMRVVGPQSKLLPGAKLGPAQLTPGPVPESRRAKYPTIVPGTERIEAPAPDPAGGPPWGSLVAETEEGVPCAGYTTQAVDGRGGYADLERALFMPGVLTQSSCRRLGKRFRSQYPCELSGSYASEGALDADPFLARAKIERRIFSARIVFRAECSPEVERVTLATPRDLRTLVPSPLGHVVIAVYDGGYVDGNVDLTAHLKGGATKSMSFPFAF